MLLAETANDLVIGYPKVSLISQALARSEHRSQPLLRFCSAAQSPCTSWTAMDL
jgi:hypothetical protein